jgi:hypothetical protein
MFNHAASVDGQPQSNVCCTYFPLTGAQGRTLLSFSFPTDRATRTHHNGAAHAAEFKEWKLNALMDRIAKLGAPARITVHCEVVVLVFTRRHCVGVGLGVGYRREGHVGVHWIVGH